MTPADAAAAPLLIDRDEFRASWGPTLGSPPDSSMQGAWQELEELLADYERITGEVSPDADLARAALAELELFPLAPNPPEEEHEPPGASPHH